MQRSRRATRSADPRPRSDLTLRLVRVVAVTCDRGTDVAAASTVEPVHIVSRIFGARRHVRAQPSDAEVAAVDVTRMMDQARARGDARCDDEILAALLVGADLTAERHPDPE